MMTETQSDNSTTSSGSEPSGADQTNREERGELSPAVDSGTANDDRSNSSDSTAMSQGTTESSAAELGPNGADSRVLTSSAEVNASASMPEVNSSQAPPQELTHTEAPKQDTNSSQASTPEANSSQATPQEATHTEAPKPEAMKQDSLTKDQITKIISDSKSLDDAKLNLGLGPATDKALSDYLSSKGFSPPGSMQQAPEQQYSGPSIGPTPSGQEVVSRNIMVTTSEGTVMVERHGTEQELNDMQDAANHNAMVQMVNGLGAALGGTDGARDDGSGTYRGSGSPGSGSHW